MERRHDVCGLHGNAMLLSEFHCTSDKSLAVSDGGEFLLEEAITQHELVKRLEAGFDGAGR